MFPPLPKEFCIALERLYALKTRSWACNTHPLALGKMYYCIIVQGLIRIESTKKHNLKYAKRKILVALANRVTRRSF